MTPFTFAFTELAALPLVNSSLSLPEPVLMNRAVLPGWHGSVPVPLVVIVTLLVAATLVPPSLSVAVMVTVYGPAAANVWAKLTDVLFAVAAIVVGGVIVPGAGEQTDQTWHLCGPIRRSFEAKR